MANPSKMNKHHCATQIPPSMFPRRTTYFDKNMGEMDFDPSIETLTAIDFAHLLDRDRLSTRLPKPFCDMHFGEISARIIAGFHITLKKAEANTRLGVPQFFRDKNNGGKGEVQVMLPISLDFQQGVPHCAVVLRRVSGAGLQPDYYLPTTLLSIEMAFTHARLIQQVDQLWLTSVNNKH
jgi:hypothetical protein